MKSIYFLSKILDCKMIWLKSRIYSKKEYIKGNRNKLLYKCDQFILLLYSTTLNSLSHHTVIQKEKRQNRI